MGEGLRSGSQRQTGSKTIHRKVECLGGETPCPLIAIVLQRFRTEMRGTATQYSRIHRNSKHRQLWERPFKLIKASISSREIWLHFIKRRKHLIHLSSSSGIRTMIYLRYSCQLRSKLAPSKRQTEFRVKCRIIIKMRSKSLWGTIAEIYPSVVTTIFLGLCSQGIILKIRSLQSDRKSRWAKCLRKNL